MERKRKNAAGGKRLRGGLITLLEAWATAPAVGNWGGWIERVDMEELTETGMVSETCRTDVWKTLNRAVC